MLSSPRKKKKTCHSHLLHIGALKHMFKVLPSVEDSLQCTPYCLKKVVIGLFAPCRQTNPPHHRGQKRMARRQPGRKCTWEILCSCGEDNPANRSDKRSRLFLLLFLFGLQRMNFIEAEKLTKHIWSVSSQNYILIVYALTGCLSVIA